MDEKLSDIVSQIMMLKWNYMYFYMFVYLQLNTMGFVSHFYSQFIFDCIYIIEKLISFWYFFFQIIIFKYIDDKDIFQKVCCIQM